MADILLKAGADINMRNEDGNSALHVAVEKNHVDTVKALVKYASVSSKNNKQKTALDLAKEAKHKDIVSTLENCLKTHESQQGTGISKNKLEVASGISTQAGVTPKSNITTQSVIRYKSGVMAYATAMQADLKERKNLVNQKKETDRSQDRLMAIEKRLDEVVAKLEKLEIQQAPPVEQAASVDMKVHLLDAVSEISEELDTLSESTAQARGESSFT